MLAVGSAAPKCPLNICSITKRDVCPMPHDDMISLARQSLGIRTGRSVEGIGFFAHLFMFFSPFCCSGQLTTCYILRLFQANSSGSFLLVILRLIHHAPNLCIEFAGLIIQAVVTTMINHNDLPGTCKDRKKLYRETPHFFLRPNLRRSVCSTCAWTRPALILLSCNFQPRRGLICVVFRFGESARCPDVGHHETFLSHSSQKWCACSSSNAFMV